jgi:N-acetylmuramoyl-L-alanine amidase
MKFAVRLLGGWLVVAMALASANGAASSMRTSSPGYVRLNDWAQANQFVLRWQDNGKTLQLSNHLARLEFNAEPRQDLRKAEINGVGVWLAFPMNYRNRSAYISRTDLEHTIDAILSPAANPGGRKIKTICLDPGHGGSDPGEISGSSQEKKYTLLLAREVRDQLVRAGFNVFLTRSTDTAVKLPERTELARKRNADLFVSLHFNSYSGPGRSEVSGIEVYCCTPAGATSFNSGGEGDTRWIAGNRFDEKNLLLAYQVQRSIVKSLTVEDRGVKRARYAVLREASMPAILVEGGFMSHPSEGKKIIDPVYRRQLGRAIANGILAYQKNVKG